MVKWLLPLVLAVSAVSASAVPMTFQFVQFGFQGGNATVAGQFAGEDVNNDGKIGITEVSSGSSMYFTGTSSIPAFTTGSPILFNYNLSTGALDWLAVGFLPITGSRIEIHINPGLSSVFDSRGSGFIYSTGGISVRQVSDGGATLALLGLSLCGVAMVRQRIAA